MKDIVPREVIEQRIYIIRGMNVMLDSDLAKLYKTSTKAVIQAVKRNKTRFPKDFMFKLNQQEVENLRSQIVTSSWGGRRYLPYAFTEQGVAMLSSVLKSRRAIQVNIAIMRTFVKLRSIVISHKKLKKKLNELEEKYDTQFRIVFDAIRELMKPEEKKTKRIGFY